MKSNTIKLVLLACVALGLGYLLFIKEPQAPKIITTYNSLPAPVAKAPEPQIKQVVPAPTAPATEAVSVEMSTASNAQNTEVNANTSTTAPTQGQSIVDKIDLKDLKVQYLDPNTPCPAKQLSCFAEPGGMIIDASCPTYKPVWAYVSLDKGLSWVQVGCFATEIDASRAIEKAKQTGTTKPVSTVVAGKLKPADKPSEKASVASIPPVSPPVANNTTASSSTAIEQKPQEKITDATNHAKSISTAAEPKTAEAKAEVKPENKVEVKAAAKEEKNGHAAGPVAHETEKPAVNEPAAAKNEKIDKPKTEDLTVTFRTAFGLVSVEKRTYPNLEMKQKAIKMWDNGQKLLEPDGSINEKYTVKPNDSNVIPGVQ